MADDDSGSPLIDWARGVYKAGNDLGSKIPTPGYRAPDDKSTDPGKLPQQWEDANKRAADAQLHPAQTKAQKRPSVAPKVAMKSAQKSSPRKQGY